jgi:hypothetical protein
MTTDALSSHGAGPDIDGAGGGPGGQAWWATEDAEQLLRSPSQGKKANRADKPGRDGPRQGSLGRKGGGRALGTPHRSNIHDR